MFENEYKCALALIWAIETCSDSDATGLIALYGV